MSEPIPRTRSAKALPRNIVMGAGFRASKRDDGHWQLGDIKAEYGSPDGALHLGPQHVVLETAAIDLAADLVGTDRLQMQTWHVMHLSRGKVGPFRLMGLRPTRRTAPIGLAII